MQSVQLPNVGILRSKKGYNNGGADVGLKVYVKYKNIGSGTKCILEFLSSGRYSRFWLGNEVFLPRVSGRLNGMES